MLITVDTFDTRVAFVPDTFTHRIFVDLGIPLGNTRGIKIDRIPSIDQRKVSFDVEPSSQNHPERNLPLPLPIKCRPNFSFYALRRALVIFAGVMPRVCMPCVGSRAARLAGASIHSKLSASFLTFLHSRYLCAPRFRRIMRPRGLMQHHRGGKAKYEAYFSLRHFQRKIIALGN